MARPARHSARNAGPRRRLGRSGATRGPSRLRLAVQSHALPPTRPTRPRAPVRLPAALPVSPGDARGAGSGRDRHAGSGSGAMTDLRLILGECTAAMRAMPEGSVDAIVTDPPYGLEFMGKAWDKFRVDPRTARWSAEKSGGAGAHIREDDGKAHGRVAFHKRRTTSVCRTCGKRDAFRNEHACGERADWTTIPVDRTPIEARAFQNWCETWALEAYRVLKPGAHMLAFGGSRTHHRMISGLEDAGFDVRDCLMWLYGSGFPKSLSVGDGWGTALKPSYEAIVLVRKPLGERSVAANVARFGTGALNVDGSRIGDVDTRQLSGPGFLGLMNDDGWEPREVVSGSPLGRWPANVTLDEAAAALLDEKTGELVSGANPESRAGDRERVTFGSFKGQGDADPQRGVDAGGASRF